MTAVHQNQHRSLPELPYATSGADVAQVVALLVPLIGERGAAILGAFYGGAPSKAYMDPGLFESALNFVAGDPQTYAEDAGEDYPYLPADEPGFFDSDRDVPFYLARLADADPELAAVITTGGTLLGQKREGQLARQAEEDVEAIPGVLAEAAATTAAAVGDAAAGAGAVAGDVLGSVAGGVGKGLGAGVGAFVTGGGFWALLVLAAVVVVLLSRQGVL
jgi:hypothetical protein